MSITAPPRPVFSPPTVGGAALTRTNNFTIFYVAGTGVSVIGGASDGPHGQNNTQPDKGTFVGLDVSGFNPGAGTLSIQRELQNPITGTGFHSATEKFFINKTGAVTWQEGLRRLPEAGAVCGWRPASWTARTGVHRRGYATPPRRLMLSRVPL